MVETPIQPKRVVEQLQALGHEAYLVGGCVRDSILGRTPKDWDVATSATPDEVKRAFDKVIPTGIDFGTVTVLMDDGYGDAATMPIEVTTFRGDGSYTDGRRPDSVNFVESIELDLMRRDFTINAMAWDPVRRRLVDPYGGQADLQAKVIRCVGSPSERFQEDRLRVLRAIRFAITLDFQIEPHTFFGVLYTLDQGLGGVASERRQVEFLKMLRSPNAERRMPDFFEKTRHTLWRAFHMNDTDEDLTFEGLSKIPDRDSMKLAHLFREWNRDDIEAVLVGLKMPSEIIRSVPAMVKMRWTAIYGQVAWSAEARQWIRLCREARVDPTEIIVLIRVEGEDRADLVRLLDRELMRNPPVTIDRLALKGDDVARIRGLTGRKIGEALRFLLHEVIDDPERNTVHRLTEALKEWGRP